jgi:hypothetical protein
VGDGVRCRPLCIVRKHVELNTNKWRSRERLPFELLTGVTLSTEQEGAAVMLYTRFRKMLLSNLGGDTGYPKMFRGFRQSLQKMSQQHLD